MEANGIKIAESVPASRKLQRTDATTLLKEATTLIVAKGKKVNTFSLEGNVPAEAVASMLGPTGNMRAPTLQIGKTLIVGFNEDVFTSQFG